MKFRAVLLTILFAINILLIIFLVQTNKRKENEKYA
jgi:hypothetical protein